MMNAKKMISLGHAEPLSQRSGGGVPADTIYMEDSVTPIYNEDGVTPIEQES